VCDQKLPKCYQSGSVFSFPKSFYPFHDCHEKSIDTGGIMEKSKIVNLVISSEILEENPMCLSKKRIRIYLIDPFFVFRLKEVKKVE